MSQFRNKNNYFLVAVVFVLAVVFLYFVFSWVKKYRTAVTPVYSDSVSLVFDSKQALIKKIVSLQSTLDAQNASLVALSSLESENENLKEQFGRSFDKSVGVLARVIVPPNRSLYDIVVLDAGTDEGIEIGQIVYAFGDIALGTISDVSQKSSTVLLYSAPKREIVGNVTGSNVAVTLIGRGSGEYEVRLPRDVSFDQGGIISSQTLEVHTLATIQKIVTDARDPFQRLLAKVPVNLQTLKWVIVK
ncbi:MAG: hypothetical protein KBC11_01610 [Candidatus Pacebacteria bacterium]|nr:hypothetical protein [Candidatus Paceibacterota bacterium]